MRVNMQVQCEQCGRKEDYRPAEWRCACGGAWILRASQPLVPELIAKDTNSLWRYSAFFPPEIQKMRNTLAAGFTPLLPCRLQDRDVLLKMDYLNPTASFKDRGVELMMNAMAAAGIERVVEDSSGNAGASVAAYSACLGMKASIFAPALASPMKLAQISLYGAEVRLIPGARQNASHAALEELEKGAIYASHAYNPVYLLGQQTAAWEVWEQSGYHAPDWVAVPVGQGGNLLGYYEGFRALLVAGLIEKIPGIIAVQPERLAPLCDAYHEGWEEWHTVPPPQDGSVAEGLAITQPVRWKQIIAAIKESHGFCVKVAEEDILPAQRRLAGKGFYVEPSSAVIVAALNEIYENVERKQTIVLSLTGSGLKSGPLTSQ